MSDSNDQQENGPSKRYIKTILALTEVGGDLTERNFDARADDEQYEQWPRNETASVENREGPQPGAVRIAGPDRRSESESTESTETNRQQRQGNLFEAGAFVIPTATLVGDREVVGERVFGVTCRWRTIFLIVTAVISIVAAIVGGLIGAGVFDNKIVHPSTLPPTPSPTIPSPTNPSPTPSPTTAATAGPPRSFCSASGCWTQLGSDLVERHDAGGDQGYCLSLASNGTRVVIGLPYRNSLGDTENIVDLVRVYDIGYEDDAFTPVGQDIILGKNRIKCVLSRDGRRLAVAERFDSGKDGNQYAIGRVRVFQLEFGNWTLLGDPIYGEIRGDRFGSSVDFSFNGSIVAIGADENLHRSGEQKGRVGVYQYMGRSWKKLGSNIVGEAEDDYSGRAVSLSDDGTIVAIGANNNDGTTGKVSGHVRVYKYETGNWTQRGSDIDGEAAFHNFGVSSAISADGKTVAASSSYANGTGHVRVFSYDVPGNRFRQMGQNLVGDTAGDRLDEVSMSANGKRVATGTAESSNDTRYVRVYDYNGDTWQPVGGNITGHAWRYWYREGIVLSTDGRRLLVGAGTQDQETERRGVVRLYELR